MPDSLAPSASACCHPLRTSLFLSPAYVDRRRSEADRGLERNASPAGCEPVHGWREPRCRPRRNRESGAYAPPAFLAHFTVFVLACFVGYMVIWNVTPALHTPLMSVTNAISSIIAIGALVQVAPFEGEPAGRPTAWIIGLAVASIALVAINMFGGFAVTQRMLQMFRK